MKNKLLKISLLSCLSMSILLFSSSPSSKVDSFIETTNDSYGNAQRVDIRKVSIGEETTVKHSKTYVQTAQQDGISYLRFATAILTYCNL